MTDPTLAAILRSMPNMPRDVAEQWLLPHARRSGYGWPPSADGGSAPWSLNLAGRTLTWWHDRQWFQDSLPMTLDVMSHATQLHVRQLLDKAGQGQDYLPDSAGRIASVRAHIAQTGTWPLAPVAYPDSDGLALIDGHHRLAALEAARAANLPDLLDRHAVWIALPPTA